MPARSQAEERQRRIRFWASLLTVVVVGAAYGLLAKWQVPESRFDREIYERIDWVRFVPRLQPEPEISEQPEPEAEAEASPGPSPPAPKVEQRIDISSVMEKLRIGNLTPEPLDPTAPKVNAPEEPAGILKINPESVERISGLKSLLKNSRSPLSLPDLPQPGVEPGAGTGRLAVEGGTDLEVRQHKLGQGGGTLSGPGGKDTGLGPGVEITLKDLASLGSNYQDFSPIYKALVEWMRRHPSPFPPAVKRLMTQEGWDPNFLTSEVRFSVGDRFFRMFLMCKEELYEVHICLVEGVKSTYLIDRGFQERSNYLRIGEVNVQEDGSILAFGTQREASSDVRTKEFYQIFLSWWDTVKEEVEELLE
jgi:hypothetical protein